jgi:hypothetical protein
MIDPASFDPTSPIMIIFGIIAGIILVIICCVMASISDSRESYNRRPSISDMIPSNVSNAQKTLPEKPSQNHANHFLHIFPVIGVCVVGGCFVLMLICSVLLVMFPESPSDIVSAMTISVLLFLVLFFAGIMAYDRLSNFPRIVQILLKIYWVGTFMTASAVIGLCLISQFLLTTGVTS